MAKAAEKPPRSAVERERVPEALRPMAEGLEANWRIYAAGVGGVLLVLVGVAVLLQSQAHGRELAAQAAGAALAEVDKPVLNDATDAKPEAPQANGAAGGAAKGAGDGAARPDAKLPAKGDAKVKAPTAEPATDAYRSEAEKQQAVASKAQTTLDAYGDGSPAGRVALLTLADARYKLAKFPEAVEAYSRLLGVAPEGDTLRAFGQIGLAYALLAEGKKEEALNAARGLVDHPPAGFGRDLGLLAEGKIAEDLHQPEVAKQAYKQLRGEASDSAAGREANDRLTLLGEPPLTPGGSPGGAPGLAGTQP